MSYRLVLGFFAIAGSLIAIPPLPGHPINAPIAKGASVRYLDLLRLICADLEVDDDDATKATASEVIAIREVGTKDTHVEAEGDIGIESVKTVALLKNRALLVFVMSASESEPQMSFMALFELSPKRKLVDVVGVPGFPDDAGDYESSLPLNETAGAYVFAAYHSNSSQGYAINTILFVHGNRIEKIMDVGTLSSHGYGEIQAFQEEVKFSTLAAPGQIYRSIVIKATLKRLPDDPDADYRPLRRGYTRLYSAVYRWDAAAGKFVTTSQELKTLDAFNRKNN